MKFKITPGEFKHPIKIEGIIPIKVENIPMENYTVKFTTKAKIINGHGDEYFKNHGSESKIIKTFYIRFNNSIEVTDKDYVIYAGTKYNIIYVNNIEEANRFLELKCEVTK